MQVTTDRAPDGGGRLIEFLLIYVVAPVVMAVVLPANWMFPALFAITIAGILLLAATPGFRWRDLLCGWRSAFSPANLALMLAFALVTATASCMILRATRPEALFSLIHHRPLLLAMILALYPWLSALPQEIIYRVLFFRRYAGLMPGPRAAILINAALFSFAHLMYWSWVVAILTFAGGIIFAWAYEIRRSFVLAFLLHAIAGWVLFAFGMGLYFYAGNAVRPF